MRLEGWVHGREEVGHWLRLTLRTGKNKKIKLSFISVLEDGLFLFKFLFALLNFQPREV